MKHTLTTLTIIASLATTATTAFELGADPALLQNRAIHGTIAADMLVGDKMRVVGFDFCSSEGRFMLLGQASPSKKSEYSSELIVTRTNGGGVSVTVSTDHMLNPDRRDAGIELINCSVHYTDEFIPVTDINGFTSLEAYLASDFVTSLPLP
jgi:hypothetical protein